MPHLQLLAKPQLSLLPDMLNLLVLNYLPLCSPLRCHQLSPSLPLWTACPTHSSSQNLPLILFCSLFLILYRVLWCAAGLPCSQVRAYDNSSSPFSYWVMIDADSSLATLVELEQQTHHIQPVTRLDSLSLPIIFQFSVIIVGLFWSWCKDLY